MSNFDSEWEKRVFADSPARYALICRSGHREILGCIGDETAEATAAAVGGELLASSDSYDKLLEEIQALEDVMGS